MGKARRGELLLLTVLFLVYSHGLMLPVGGNAREDESKSAIGDPGMRRDGLRVAIESWNQCNEVGKEAPFMGSPRAADCFDIHQTQGKKGALCKEGLPYRLEHKVSEKENKLGVGEAFEGLDPKALQNPDLYAAEKELYLGSKCEVKDSPNHPWQFWMVMLKSGNMDTYAGLCPNNGVKVGPFGPDPRFPCFGKGCMNQPYIFHNYTRLHGANKTAMKGSFYGTWDLDAGVRREFGEGFSQYSVIWRKEIGKGSWVFHHKLTTSEKYPWLMLYLRSDATHGLSGGYHYPTRGMTKIVPESPNFKVKLKLEVIKGGGNHSQFFLIDIGSCWKNNGKPCNGNVISDVTRYTEMILNPNITTLCNKQNITHCPPHHTFPNGTRIRREDTARFPYGAYHLYCAPGNGAHLEEPYSLCDEYSNPQPQEIMQIVPHPAWGEYGFPTWRGEGWIGRPTKWELDVGRLSHSLYTIIRIQALNQQGEGGRPLMLEQKYIKILIRLLNGGLVNLTSSYPIIITINQLTAVSDSNFPLFLGSFYLGI